MLHCCVLLLHAEHSPAYEKVRKNFKIFPFFSIRQISCQKDINAGGWIDGIYPFHSNSLDEISENLHQMTWSHNYGITGPFEGFGDCRGSRETMGKRLLIFKMS